jgi:hypothetical protein
MPAWFNKLKTKVKEAIIGDELYDLTSKDVALLISVKADDEDLILSKFKSFEEAVESVKPKLNINLELEDCKTIIPKLKKLSLFGKQKQEAAAEGGGNTTPAQDGPPPPPEGAVQDGPPPPSGAVQDGPPPPSGAVQDGPPPPSGAAQDGPAPDEEAVDTPVGPKPDTSFVETIEGAEEIEGEEKDLIVKSLLFTLKKVVEAIGGQVCDSETFYDLSVPEDEEYLLKVNFNDKLLFALKTDKSEEFGGFSQNVSSIISSFVTDVCEFQNIKDKEALKAVDFNLSTKTLTAIIGFLKDKFGKLNKVNTEILAPGLNKACVSSLFTFKKGKLEKTKTVFDKIIKVYNEFIAIKPIDKIEGQEEPVIGLDSILSFGKTAANILNEIEKINLDADINFIKAFEEAYTFSDGLCSLAKELEIDIPKETNGLDPCDKTKSGNEKLKTIINSIIALSQKEEAVKKLVDSKKKIDDIDIVNLFAINKIVNSISSQTDQTITIDLAKLDSALAAAAAEDGSGTPAAAPEDGLTPPPAAAAEGADDPPGSVVKEEVAPAAGSGDAPAKGEIKQKGGNVQQNKVRFMNHYYDVKEVEGTFYIVTKHCGIIPLKQMKTGYKIVF